MRRLLLATTAISTLALAAPVALAQSSNAPSGAHEEQKQPPAKGGKTTAPTAPGEGTHNGSPAGRSAQAPAAPPNGAKHPTHQAQQVEPNAQPTKNQPRANQAQQEPPGVPQPKGEHRTHQAQQEQPGVQQPKGEHRLNGQAQTPSTTGETNTAPRNAGGGDQRPAAATRTDEGNRSGASNVGGRREVQVTEQQRRRIHEGVGHLRAQRLDRADFSLEVGAPVPQSVRLYTLPPEIVEIVPEYRGCDYVIVSDDIVIIDPESHEIVAVIPA